MNLLSVWFLVNSTSESKILKIYYQTKIKK